VLAYDGEIEALAIPSSASGPSAGRRPPNVKGAFRDSLARVSNMIRRRG